MALGWVQWNSRCDAVACDKCVTNGVCESRATSRTTHARFAAPCSQIWREGIRHQICDDSRTLCSVAHMTLCVEKYSISHELCLWVLRQYEIRCDAKAYVIKYVMTQTSRTTSISHMSFAVLCSHIWHHRKAYCTHELHPIQMYSDSSCPTWVIQVLWFFCEQVHEKCAEFHAALRLAVMQS